MLSIRELAIFAIAIGLAYHTWGNQPNKILIIAIIALVTIFLKRNIGKYHQSEELEEEIMEGMSNITTINNEALQSLASIYQNNSLHINNATLSGDLTAGNGTFTNIIAEEAGFNNNLTAGTLNAGSGTFSGAITAEEANVSGVMNVGGKIITADSLCIGEECVDQEQLQGLVSGSGGSDLNPTFNSVTIAAGTGAFNANTSGKLIADNVNVMGSIDVSGGLTNVADGKPVTIRDGLLINSHLEVNGEINAKNDIKNTTEGKPVTVRDDLKVNGKVFSNYLISDQDNDGKFGFIKGNTIKANSAVDAGTTLCFGGLTFGNDGNTVNTSVVGDTYSPDNPICLTKQDVWKLKTLLDNGVIADKPTVQSGTMVLKLDSKNEDGRNDFYDRYADVEDSNTYRFDLSGSVTSKQDQKHTRKKKEYRFRGYYGSNSPDTSKEPSYFDSGNAYNFLVRIDVPFKKPFGVVPSGGIAQIAGIDTTNDAQKYRVVVTALSETGMGIRIYRLRGCAAVTNIAVSWLAHV